MTTGSQTYAIDIATNFATMDPHAAGRPGDSLRVLLARFVSDLSCQLGLLLRQRGFRVVAQSSEAQFATLGLEGRDEECFPCTEINFPYLGRNNIESVLAERGPFDVVVFDEPDVDMQGPCSCPLAAKAQTCAERDCEITQFLADVATCAQHMAARGGAIWLFERADAETGGSRRSSQTHGASLSIHARRTFLQRLAQEPRFARVSFNLIRVMPGLGPIEAINFDGACPVVHRCPLRQRPRSSIELAPPLLDLLAVAPPRAGRASPLAAAAA